MIIDDIKKNLHALVQDIEDKKAKFGSSAFEAYAYMEGTSNLPDRDQIPHTISPYYLEPASTIYDEWAETHEYVTAKGRKCIPHPEELNLVEYLNKLKHLIYSNESRLNWIKSMFSFLNYIREDIVFPSDQEHLETIFPFKKEFMSDYILEKRDGKIIKTKITRILKNIENEDYPVDIFVYMDIIKNLVDASLNSRPNALIGAFETLGFVWLCYISALYQTRPNENYLHTLDISTIKCLNKNTYSISLDTLLGKIDIPISQTIYSHLLLIQSLHQKPTIFSRSLPSLRRPFSTAVKKSPRSENAGKITFRTMLALPHKAIGHRSSNRRPK